MVKAIEATRAPRGTKILAKAFFSAAQSVPELQRDSVIKAALALIRDEVKSMREKALLAKAKAKGNAVKVSAMNGHKAVLATKSATKPRKVTTAVRIGTEAKGGARKMRSKPAAKLKVLNAVIAAPPQSS